jgi:hypothetical protein
MAYLKRANIELISDSPSAADGHESCYPPLRWADRTMLMEQTQQNDGAARRSLGNRTARCCIRYTPLASMSANVQVKLEAPATQPR